MLIIASPTLLPDGLGSPDPKTDVKEKERARLRFSFPFIGTEKGCDVCRITSDCRKSTPREPEFPAGDLWGSLKQRAS